MMGWCSDIHSGPYETLPTNRSFHSVIGATSLRGSHPIPSEMRPTAGGVLRISVTTVGSNLNRPFRAGLGPRRRFPGRWPGLRLERPFRAVASGARERHGAVACEEEGVTSLSSRPSRARRRAGCARPEGSNQPQRPRAFIGTVPVSAATARIRLVEIAEEIISVLSSDAQATARRRSPGAGRTS
jgi:hypothetical protein